MKFCKLSLVIAFITLNVFNPGYASYSDDYAGVLNDPHDGLTLLESAQDAMFNINHALPDMMQIASQAASGTYSQDELQALDAKYQQLKQDLGKQLSNYFLAGSLIFNQGNMTIFKEGKSINVDLNHKDPYSLGFNNDDIKTIDHARVATYHLNNAVAIVTDWLSEAEKNDKTLVVNQSYPYFDSCVLHLKTAVSVNSVLQSVQSERNRLLSELQQLLALASQATSDSLTQEQRDNMQQQFEALSDEMYIDENRNFFNDIKAFDGSVLEVHDGDRSYRSFDLPELTLKSLGISNDDLLTSNNALQTLTDLNSVRDQIHLWLVTGKFDFSYKTRKNLTNQLHQNL